MSIRSCRDQPTEVDAANWQGALATRPNSFLLEDVKAALGIDFPGPSQAAANTVNEGRVSQKLGFIENSVAR
ncbi:MAG: hypothetical protein Q9216_002197 [Gyalolechia sp. 2 TL-2023]